MSKANRRFSMLVRGFHIFMDDIPSRPGLVRFNLARTADNPPREGQRNRYAPVLDFDQVAELHAATGEWLAANGGTEVGRRIVPPDELAPSEIDQAIDDTVVTARLGPPDWANMDWAAIEARVPTDPLGL